MSSQLVNKTTLNASINAHYCCGSNASTAVLRVMKVWPFIILAFLVGCASSVKTVTKVSEVLYDPDIQVGSNEVQPSTVSLALLTSVADTTVSENVKRGFFSAKSPKDHYLLKIYELGKSYTGKEDATTLSANQVIEIMSGEYLGKHEYYMKLEGYRFVKHFALDKDVKNLVAVVHFEEPKCTLWSSLRAVKNIGEEYNFYMQADERRFLFRSELDVTAPGEPLKVDNRFIGACKSQDNAALAMIETIEVEDDVLASIQAYQNAANGKEKVVADKTSADAKNTINNVSGSSVVEIKEPSNKYTKKAVLPNKWKSNTATSTKAELKEKVVVESKVKAKAKSTTAVKEPNTTKDLINILVEKNIKSLVLTKQELSSLPSYVDKAGNKVYFVPGIGVVKTKSGSLNVREAPGAKSRRVATVNKGKSIQVQRYTPMQKGWLYIESEGVKSGWVTEALIKWQKL